MEHFTYLIIGGGMAADSAVKGIREIDLTGRIGLISQENFAPYDRPPLTKGLWFGKDIRSIWRKTESENISLYLGKKVVSIQPEKHLVSLASGEIFKYEKLLLATGGTPNKLPCSDDGVIYYRTLSDYYQVRELYDKGNDFLIIGGGFIGTELAAALAMNGKNVTLVIKDPTIGSRLFPKKMSTFLNAFYTEKGVRLLCSQEVVSVKQESGKFNIKTDQGQLLQADAVVAGLGITPGTTLAKSINITVDNGIVVDQHLNTTQPNIWAAGDVANFYSPQLEKRLRIEHEDSANSTGKAAGRNMAGANEAFSYLPFFYSDLFELGYEAIGEINCDMEIIEEWSDPYREGSLYYLRDGKLRGAFFLNNWNQIEKARELIASKAPFRASFVN